MNQKITYLLGAGASYNAFPLAKTVKEPSGGKKEGLAEAMLSLGTMYQFSYGSYNKITDSLIETGRESIKFGNVDSYAKYLYHKGDSERLNNLKLALTFFFIDNQLNVENKKTDNRYLNFVTSVIDELNRFPKDVKIISWNYDYLLEETCEMYNSQPERFFHVRDSFQHQLPFVSYFPAHGLSSQSDDYSIIHLNGICGFFIRNGMYHSIFNDFKGRSEEYDSVKLMQLFSEKYSTESHLLTFAWEKNSDINRQLGESYNIAKKAIDGTTILVVIGYSFPFYNRNIDNMIFKVLAPTLKKIYYQDPYIDGEFLRTRYNIAKPSIIHSNLPGSAGVRTGVSIEQIKEIEQFYVPIEL